MTVTGGGKGVANRDGAARKAVIARAREKAHSAGSEKAPHIIHNDIIIIIIITITSISIIIITVMEGQDTGLTFPAGD